MPHRGRPHKIAPEEQVRRAMRLFWRKGYYDTSVDDLVSDTGINRYTVCTAHGGKKSLFEKALALYEAEVTSSFLAVLETDGAGLFAIRDFFCQFLAFLEQPIGAYGCLLCNTSSEVAPDDPAIANRIERYIARLTGALRRAAQSAKARGELREGVDLDQFADYCAGSVLGIMSFSRSPAPRRAVRNYVQGILHAIDAVSATAKPSPPNDRKGKRT